MNISSLAVGQTIELNENRTAIIRFLGPTHFQTGDWVGVELDEATGKNDGSVKGERYFQCQQGHGMFLRPAGVRRILEAVEQTKPKAAASNGVAKPRPSSIHSAVNGIRRQGAGDGVGRRASTIAESPTPGSRMGSAGGRSPAKSPTKQLGSNGFSSSSTSRTSTPPGRSRPAAGAIARPRPSLAPAAVNASGMRTGALPPSGSTSTQRTSRLSLASSSAGVPVSSRGVPPRPAAPPVRPSLRQSHEPTTEEADDSSERPSLLSPRTDASAASEHGEDGTPVPADQYAKPNFAPPPIPPDPPPVTTRPRRPSSPSAASVHSQRTIRSSTAVTRQNEELEAKVRLLERKRQEDREVKKLLEQAQLERDQYKAIIEKLQNKYRPQQQELADLKHALSESEKKLAEIEASQSEHDSIIELATLDREMAEEKAETLQAEVDALRARNEEIELELEILREENGELSKEMSPEERSSAGWLQMEKSNERLREALLRLRDITQDKEDELREQINDLQAQVKELDALRAEYGEMKEKLLRSEADTTDLRAQLEAALESEEVIDTLTERNAQLDVQVNALRATIEELEDLRELNDELQINYNEQEKQLQEEIDFKDSLLIDRERTAKQQQEALDEADYTLTRYRALVNQMQSDLADLQASKQISEAEAKDLSDKGRAMLDLNMKLQASAAKTHIKTIDLELRKLDAEQAKAQLEIVQLFLPDTFDAERNSILALLRFRRIAFKAELVIGFVRERIASFDVGSRVQQWEVFAACHVLDKLTWVAGMAQRFAASISCCPIDDFASYEIALHELEPVEKALNAYIEALRREELNEAKMVDELQRSIAVMEHLGSVLFKSDLASQADDLLMRTMCLQGGMESVATALSLIKDLVANNVRPPQTEEGEDSVENDDDDLTEDLKLILTRAELLMTSARNAKVLCGKTHRSMVELQVRSLTIESEHVPIFDGVENLVAKVAMYTREAGQAIQHLFLSDESRTDRFTPAEVSSVLSTTATSVFDLQSPEAGPFTTLATKLRALQDQLADLAALPTDLDNTVEFERPPEPWLARAAQLKQTKATSRDIEAELARSLDTLRERDAVLKAKDTELEEQGVRIEMLEARMKEAGKRSARIGELERLLHEAKVEGERAKHEVVKAREEAEKEVERVRAAMGRLGDESRRAGQSGELRADALGTGARAKMRMLEGKTTSLEGAVRFLSEENLRLKVPGPDSPLSAQKTLDWLREPLVHLPRTETQRKTDMLRAKGKDLLQAVLVLATQELPHGGLVDLSKVSAEKLAWRPAKTRPRWIVERKKDEWAMIHERSRDVLSLAADRVRTKARAHPPADDPRM